MPSTIRPIQANADVYRCVDLLRLAFGTVARDFGLTESSSPTNAAFTTFDSLSLHIREGMDLYGKFVDAELVGCVAVKQAKRDGRVYSIERLAVAPRRRHCGHGGELLAFAVERIREAGGATASIGLIDDNRVLKEWYLSKGFVQHDRRRVAHLPFRVCFMSLSIAN